MTKRLAVLLFAFSAFLISCRSKKESAVTTPPRQPEPWVFTYGKDTVFRSEFEHIYSKNNKDTTPDEKSVREYLDLYVNFKLKVKEAYDLKLDTLEGFITELSGYRKQLAQPYLVDKKVTDDLVEEAYERMKYEVNTSHILITCDEDAAPADTLTAYTKAADLRKRIMAGENFDSLAAKYSDDPSATVNHGSLGYYTAFQLVYPYETAMYNTPVGQVTPPVRSRFGYHVIKVVDKRPARGDVKVAHIMIKINQGSGPEKIAELKRKADSLYMRISKGESYNDLCKQYSDDFSTRNNGGELNWFSGTSNMPNEFKEAAFSLQKPGDVSRPVKTDYGWHIIRLIEKRDLPSKDKMIETIKGKIARDSRSELNRNAVLVRIKKENNYTADDKALQKFIRLVDSSLVKGTWRANENTKKPVKLFSLGKNTYTYADFSRYIELNQAPKAGHTVPVLVHQYYNDFVSFTAFDYEEKHLDEKYESFRDLMREYKDGILLFALTDQKVWSRSVNDTTGLEKFFNMNREKYMWKERADAVIYDCVDVATAEKIYKILSGKKPESDSALLKKFNKDNPLTLSIRSDKYEKGTEEALAPIEHDWAPRLYKTSQGKRFYVVKIKAILQPQPKALSEVRGMVTSEYQSYLEKEWLKELRGKYPVVVNEETVKTLFK